MEKAMYLYKLASLALFFSTIAISTPKTTPKLTVIVVVDQFGHNNITKLYPHLQYGLKTLVDKGIVYKNTYLPHGMPATGTGHAGLNTGTYAKDHGIIANAWVATDGKFIECDDDTAEHAAVLTPHGAHNYGKSASNIMVDGISDQFMLASQPTKPHLAFGVSLKSRAAIGTAGKLGKALWFDNKTGLFTSSKAYFDKLPQWIIDFSYKHQSKIDNFTWELLYPEASTAYNFFNTQDYTYAQQPYNLINKPISVDKNAITETSYDDFCRSPLANKLVFDLALACIDEYSAENNMPNMLLWVCVSSFDKLGHTYGIESMEALDMIYQLDKQLQNFMETIYTKFNTNDVLIGLTADHGSGQIIEMVRDRGLYDARRIPLTPLAAYLNQQIKNTYGIENCIIKIKQPHCYFDMKLFNTLDSATQKNIIQDIKRLFLEQPGIKQVWTYDELRNSFYDSNQLENYFKQQLFKGRSGQLIIQTYPYVIITDNKNGLSHKTPYEYDTHIPLILYQPGNIEGKKVEQRVWGLQLANTLADILEVPKPSASTFEVLPGIFATP